MRTRSLSLLGVLTLSALTACAVEGDEEADEGGAAFSGFRKPLGRCEEHRQRPAAAHDGRLRHRRPQQRALVERHGREHRGAGRLRGEPRDQPRAPAQREDSEPQHHHRQRSRGALRRERARYRGQPRTPRAPRRGADKYYVESAFAANARASSTSWSFGADGLEDARLRSASRRAPSSPRASSSRPRTTSFDSLLQRRSRRSRDARLRLPAVARGHPRDEAGRDVRASRRRASSVGTSASALQSSSQTRSARSTYRIVVSARRLRRHRRSARRAARSPRRATRSSSTSASRTARASPSTRRISDGWGIKGICDDGQRCLREVETAAASASTSRASSRRRSRSASTRTSRSASRAAPRTPSSRVSLSRFRFHLDHGQPGRGREALQQALKFDVRLAQAMYNRDSASAARAVTAEFDAVRAATTTTRSFGFELLGMNIYHRAVVERRRAPSSSRRRKARRRSSSTPSHKDGGWFQMRPRVHAARASPPQTLDAPRPGRASRARRTCSFRPPSATSTWTTTSSSTTSTLPPRLVGPDAVDDARQVRQPDGAPRLGKVPGRGGSRRQHAQFDEECNVRLLDDPEMIRASRPQGLAAIEPIIAGLPADYKTVVREAAKVRLTLQSVGIHNFDAANGPNASFTTRHALRRQGARHRSPRSRRPSTPVRSASTSPRSTRTAARSAPAWTRTPFAPRSRTSGQATSRRWRTVFETRAKAYRIIADAERLVPVALQGRRFISYPLGIRFAVDA